MLKPEHVVDVTRFGAVPDSEKDCTEALQRAVQFAADNPIVRSWSDRLFSWPWRPWVKYKTMPIYLPLGAYKVQSSIRLESPIRFG